MLDGEAIAGVSLCIIGGIVDNIGVTIQKLSHRQSPGVKYFTRPFWITGVSLYLLGNICNAVGLSLAPQSDVAAVGSLTLVWNAINSYCILGEELNRFILIGIIIVICGSLSAVAFGSPAPTATLETISHIDLFAILYIAFTAGFLCSCALIIRSVQRQQDADRKRRYSRVSSQVDPLLVDQSCPRHSIQEDFIIIPPDVQRKGALFAFFSRELFLSISLPVCTGILGSFTVLCAKACTVLVRASFTEHGFNHFKSWPLYVALILTLTIGSTQIHFLNLALRAYDQLIVVPAFAVVLEAFNILGGMIVYKDGANLSKLQMFLFVLCVFISFVGVGFIIFGLRFQRVVLGNSSMTPTPRATIIK